MSRLVDGRQASIISLNNADSNGTAAAYNGLGTVATTRSDVNITAADDPESIVAFGTELLVASDLVRENNPFQQSSQNNPNGTLIVEDTENGPIRIAPFDRTRANIETRVRKVFGINPGEYLRLSKYEMFPLDLPPTPTADNPFGNRGPGTGATPPPRREKPGPLPPCIKGRPGPNCKPTD